MFLLYFLPLLPSHSFIIYLILSWPMAAMRFFDPLACLAERRGVLRPVSNSISFFLFLISFPFPTFLFSSFSYLQGCPRPKRKYGAGDTDTGPQGMGFPGLSRLFLTTRANEQTKDTDGVYEVSFFTSFSISDLLFSCSIFLCLLLSFYLINIVSFYPFCNSVWTLDHGHVERPRVSVCHNHL